VPGILADLRIVDVSAFIAGPLGGMTLAQLGADVIRIDPIDGNIDINRWSLAPSGDSLYWVSLNKAERSVCLTGCGKTASQTAIDTILYPC
jgi:2-methylfumaryl-CoA isomerase